MSLGDFLTDSGTSLHSFAAQSGQPPARALFRQGY